MSVYFAQAGGYVKIGYSADPFARATTVTLHGTRPSDLRRGAETNLIGWVPGQRDTEAGWHRHFARDHVAGEWFYIDPNVVRDLIWADPRGVDLQRMSALAVFTAAAQPLLTRDQIARSGVRVAAVPEGEAIAALGAGLRSALRRGRAA